MNVLNMFCKDAFNSEILWINENNVNILSGNEIEAIKGRNDATDIYFIQSLSALKYGLSDGPFAMKGAMGNG